MQRALIQITLFIILLLLVIYLTSPGSSASKTYKWSKIHYKTTASKLPESRGICPGLEASKKPALVMSRVTSDGDMSWLEGLAKKYHRCVYTADIPLDTNSKYLQVPANRGHEAMGYLTFIIDNYEKIPAAGAVFIHGSRWAWHNDHQEYDNAVLLEALDVSSALELSGYHNLRCDWSLSTCPTSYVPQGSIENSVSAVLEPWDKRVVSDAALPRALSRLFGGSEDGNSLLGRGDAVRSQCCAQFVVSRESLWRHEKEEYVALRQWLLDGSSGKNGNAAPADDKVAGRILSYVWHILFMKHDDTTTGIDLQRLNSLACPRAADCYCRLYGRCELERCTSASCFGQYRLPPNLKVESPLIKVEAM